VAIFVLGSTFLLVGGNGRAGIRHTCSVTDRQFIGAAQLNMAALGSLSADYLRGAAEPGEVIEQADFARKSIRDTDPTDPSLSRTRAILRAMFSSYAKAVRAESRHGNPGAYIYRAYGLANFAHDVLADARPELQKRGCDITSLL